MQNGSGRRARLGCASGMDCFTGPREWVAAMHAFSKFTAILGLLLAASVTFAQEQIPWAADFQQASELAGSQNRLILLHFYGDNCAPCERVEQQVFSQAKVAQAIAKNYVPVKVHVSKSPELAARYQVNRWPTDVICTAAGLEVQRTISPQNPDEYVAMIDQVALQAGVGAARQWSSSMPAVASAAGRATADAQAFANRVGTTANNYANQANAAAQGYATQGQQQLAQAGQQYNQAAQQANAAAGQAQQQWNDTSKQFQGDAQQVQGTAQTAATDLRSTWNGAATGLRSAWTGGGVVAAAPEPQAAPVPQQSQQAPPLAPIGTVPPGGYVLNPPAAAPQQQYQPQQDPTTNPYLAATQPAVAPAQPSVAPAQQPQQPIHPDLVPASQAPAVALEGYCTVSLLDSMKWTKADAQFGAIHHGRTFLFVSAAEQQKFLANPDRYCPVLDGFDPVRFAKTGELVPGKRSTGLTYNKQIFLFADEASLEQFARTPQAFAAAAYQAMMQRETGNVYR